MRNVEPRPPVTPGQVDRTLQTLWLMYVVSSAVFVGVGYLLLEKSASHEMTVSEPGIIAAAIVAVFVSIAAIRVARNAAMIEDARKRLTISLIALSLAELIAIGGILAGVLLKSRYPLILLAGFSLALFFRLSSALR